MEAVIVAVLLTLLYVAFQAGRSMTEMQKTPNFGDSPKSLEQKQRVMELFIKKESIVNGDIVSLLEVDGESAYRILNSLVKEGHIDMVKKGDYISYTLKRN